MLRKFRFRLVLLQLLTKTQSERFHKLIYTRVSRVVSELLNKFIGSRAAIYQK